MTALRVKITGARGDWTAQVENRRLAVIHNTWLRGMGRYHDPMTEAKLDGKRYIDFLAALRNNDLVVMQRDVPGTFTRDGYIGIFYFENLVVGSDGSVSLQLTERYANPR